MKDLVEQALELQNLLAAQYWQFCFIGGVAIQRWSEPRLTQPFEQEAVRRSQILKYAPGITLRTCTAEDLLVMKAFASRVIDWNDIRSILVRQGTRKLDWPYIHRQLQPLCEVKEAPEIMTQLEKLRREIAKSQDG